jgi:hypothetical protein
VKALNHARFPSPVFNLEQHPNVIAGAEREGRVRRGLGINATATRCISKDKTNEQSYREEPSMSHNYLPVYSVGGTTGILRPDVSLTAGTGHLVLKHQ